ncbi:hypothetical protein CEJ87_18515, partial [Caldifermentibacillus hisashii]
MAGAGYPGFFPPGTAAGGTVFSAGRQRDFSRFREVAFGSSAPGRKPGGTFRSERKISRNGVRECLYPVWDFPAVSAIGTSRRAGPLAGEVPIPPAPEGQVNRGLK